MSNFERSGESSTELELMRVRLENIERQQCAANRVLQLKDEVSQLVASLDRKLDELREWRAFASDVNNRVSALSEDVKRLDATAKLIPIDPTNGIIEELTRKCGGNVHEKGVVTVTSSTVFKECDVKIVVDPVVGWFATDSAPDQWICLDFKGSRVAPTSYSIRTGHIDFPTAWIFEASNDGRNWQQLDHRQQTLTGEYVTYNFAISNPPSGSFRLFRLRQTAPSSPRGNNHLHISRLEIFGTLSSQ